VTLRPKRAHSSNLSILYECFSKRINQP